MKVFSKNVKTFSKISEALHPTDITPNHVLLWRDTLTQRRRKAATIALKLTVVRSFFEYLRAGGYVQLNPAATKVVPPPQHLTR